MKKKQAIPLPDIDLRIEMYMKVLKDYQDGWTYSSYVCINLIREYKLWAATNHEGVNVNDYVFSQLFPEFYAQKPTGVRYNEQWWPYTEKQPRIDALSKAIILAKKRKRKLQQHS
jgi:hypothetical protein